MGRFNTLQNNGTAGELSPRLARSDLQKWTNGWRLVQNFYPGPQGFITRRPGTRYLIDTKDSGARQSRLVSFVASDRSVYGLEFAHHQIRILDKDAGVLATVATTYDETQLFELTYAQSADVMYIYHGSHKQAALIHTSAAVWAIQDVDTDDGPYQPENTTATTITAAATTGSAIILTASTPIFYAAMLGTCIRLRHGTTTTTWGWGRVTTYTDTTHVKVDIDPDFPFGATTATKRWRLSEWDSVRGFPQQVCFQENRLTAAATDANPITAWATQTNAYDSKLLLYGPTKSDGTVTAAESITITLAAKDINTILWMSPGPSLAIGTISAEWLVEAASSTEAWSPTNSKQTVQTTRGSEPLAAALRIETSVIYVQQKGQKLREFTFNFTKNATQSNDMMLLADHIAAKSPIVELVYVQDPHSYLVARLANGELRFLTYVGEEDVGGWSRHILGGSFNDGSAVVESIMVLPDYDLGYDALWLVVKRTISGVTVRYIEIMQPPFYNQEKEDAWFLDCAVTASGTDLTEVVADHLEEEIDLGIYADGASRGLVTNEFGTIGLDAPFDQVLVGFRYASKLKSIPMDWPNATRLGTALGKFSKLARLDLHLYETGSGLLVGVGSVDEDPTNMDPVENLYLDTPTNTAPELITGWVHLPLGGSYDDEPVLYFEVEDPIPATILEYSPRGNANEN